LFVLLLGFRGFSKHTSDLTSSSSSEDVSFASDDEEFESAEWREELARVVFNGEEALTLRGRSLGATGAKVVAKTLFRVKFEQQRDR
jgi:hypothetical protein